MKSLKLKNIERHPLCVDLDGTLVKTDTLVEAVFALIRHNILFGSKSDLALKKVVYILRIKFSRTLSLILEFLALYYSDVLDLIKMNEQEEELLYSQPQSPHKIAEAVSAHLGLFSSVFASDDKHNLKGEAKAAFLVERFGQKGFDYIGDSRHDLAVWRNAERAYLVNASLLLEKRARNSSRVIQNMLGRSPRTRLILTNSDTSVGKKFISVHADVARTRVSDLKMWFQAVCAFFSFSFMASSVYVLNDLLDLDSDRKHPENRKGHLLQEICP